MNISSKGSVKSHIVKARYNNKNVGPHVTLYFFYRNFVLVSEKMQNIKLHVQKHNMKIKNLKGGKVP